MAACSMRLMAGISPMGARGARPRQRTDQPAELVPVAALIPVAGCKSRRRAEREHQGIVNLQRTQPVVHVVAEELPGGALAGEGEHPRAEFRELAAQRLSAEIAPR